MLSVSGVKPRSPRSPRSVCLCPYPYPCPHQVRSAMAREALLREVEQVEHELVRQGHACSTARSDMSSETFEKTIRLHHSRTRAIFIQSHLKSQNPHPPALSRPAPTLPSPTRTDSRVRQLPSLGLRERQEHVREHAERRSPQRCASARREERSSRALHAPLEARDQLELLLGGLLNVAQLLGRVGLGRGRVG